MNAKVTFPIGYQLESCASNIKLISEPVLLTLHPFDSNLDCSQSFGGKSTANMSNNRKFYIETYGCQMNFSDSEIVASVLSQNEFQQASSLEEASLILLNTCSIRDNAEQRIWKRLKELKSLKKKNPGLQIGVIGCMASRLKDELMEGGLAVDLVAGPDSYRALPSLLTNIENGQQAANVALSAEETYDNIEPVRFHSNGISAFISIMRGCENFCSYCVVPFTRGKERSRNPHTIVEEARELVSKGYQEVTLLGQNVNSYKWEDENGLVGFPNLMARIAEVSPLLRVRFTTSHPKDLSDDLLKVMASYPNICPAVHLAVQSGNNRILKLMNRKYTREWYLERVAAIRHYIPDATITTDIIAGFCSETEEEHKETLSLMEAAAFDAAFMFRYSEREGTLASKRLPDDVPDEVKARRLDEIIKLQQNLSARSNRADIGKSFEVLVEGKSKRSDDFLMGRTPQNKVVVFPARSYKSGDRVLVKITGSTPATLKGVPVTDDSISTSDDHKIR